MLWFSPGSSQFQIWYLSLSDDQTTITRDVRTVSITPGYVIAGTGDVDGNGRADLIFTSPKHDLYVWKIDPIHGFVPAYLGTYPAGWVLLGSADVDGDGTDDLLWQNPAACQFGYWRMKDGKHVATKILPVACDYTPLSIGYYSLTSRASITWMDGEHAIHVWDSTGNGFSEFDLGDFPANDYVYRLGGGRQGRGMAFDYVQAGNSGLVFRDFNRNFSISGAQSSWTKGTFGTAGHSSTEYSGGFVVRAQGFDNTAPVTFDTSVLNQSGTGTYARAMVCMPSDQAYDSITLEPNRTCAYMSLASGWFPVGYHAIP
ncbi:hypothetical protein LF63_0102940 [Oleiagrimonas soli]|uniref:VCBS repeat-containing protein n=1 Tax=Oleiagrimonas soli TaxID=1543381 RepID=A0A099CY18_9GAMM|nr:hypothetical protein LF63_0102940 [Oleiagrimonas soli]